MRVCWEVQDGYAGGACYQWTEVPDEELAECLDIEEQWDLIDSYIWEDYDALGFGRVEMNDDACPEPLER